MQFRKLKLEVTVLCEADDETRLSKHPLVELTHEMLEGSIIGRSRMISSEAVPFNDIEKEFLALRNDGAFSDALGPDP